MVQTLASLRPFVDDLLVVANGALEETGRERLRTVADDVLVRENTGMDVGGYRAGLEHLGWDRVTRLEELIMLNSTFFAPVRPWEPVLAAAAQRPEASFWGLTEHAEQRPHPFLARALSLIHI